MKNTTSLTYSLVLALSSLSLAAAYPQPAAAAGAPREVFSQAELDQMLAPIALYPDALLAQILMASTYPLEIVEATRWSRSNSGLEGEAAVDAVAHQNWDPSVQALVGFPQVLTKMDEDLTWTKRLGDAFLIQEEEVMDSIQELRQKAYAAGNLQTMEHVRVTREREVIYIKPANPRVVYVPFYQPAVVYGSWWWPAYPPVYWTSGPRYSGSTWIVWSPGVRFSSVYYYGRPDWHRRHIVVVNRHYHPPVRVRESSRYVRPRPVETERRWRHEPTHRRGVAYQGSRLHERYGRSTASGVEMPERWRQTQAPRERTSHAHQERVQRSISAERPSTASISPRTRPEGTLDRRSTAQPRPTVQQTPTASTTHSLTERSANFERRREVVRARTVERPVNRTVQREFVGPVARPTPSRNVNRVIRQPEANSRPARGVESSRSVRAETRRVLSVGDGERRVR